MFYTNHRTTTRKMTKAYMEVMSELILLVDGAGGGHSTAIISHNGEVGCTGIISSVIYWLIVVNWMGSVVCDFPSETIRKELRCHVSDRLSEKSNAVTQQIKFKRHVVMRLISNTSEHGRVANPSSEAIVFQQGHSSFLKDGHCTKNHFKQSQKQLVQCSPLCREIIGIYHCRSMESCHHFTSLYINTAVRRRQAVLHLLQRWEERDWEN